MARSNGTTITLLATAVCETALSVGGASAGLDVDLTLVRDGRGRLFVPGTSLAGVLRAWSSAAGLGTSERDRLWGDADSNGASRIVIDDAVLSWTSDAVDPGTVGDDPARIEPHDIPVESRTGVMIDRITGAAATGMLASRETVPAGATFPLRIVVSLGNAADSPGGIAKNARALLHGIVAAAAKGSLLLGAGSTRGYGRINLSDARVDEENRSTRAGMLASLARRHSSTSTGSDAEPLDVSTPGQSGFVLRRPWLSVAIDAHLARSVLVRASFEGSGVKGLPLVTRTPGGDWKVLLPGSSVKGALRSEAERIVCTIIGGTTPQAGLQQLAQHAIIERLFGAAGRSSDDPSHADPTRARHGRGALGVGDATIMTISAEVWTKLISADKPRDTAKELAKIYASGSGRVEVGSHVAIDRWTGGAADALLFATTELTPPGAVRIPVFVDPLRLSRNADDVTGRAAGWLLLIVLWRLAHGHVALGGSTRRGNGAVTRADIMFAGIGLHGGILAVLDGSRNLESLQEHELANMLAAFKQELGLERVAA